MSTPFMQVQTNSLTINSGSPGSQKFLTKDASGAAINVSSGYTVELFRCTPNNGYNFDFGAIDLSGHVTPTFDTTGVTLSWTSAQASAISALLQTLANNFVLTVSNDSGTTQTRLAAANLTISSLQGMT